MDIALVCDIMLDLEGSIRPAIYLADKLTAIGHRVSVVSPLMSRAIEDLLRQKGITPINLRIKIIAENSGLSLLWLETWAREAFLKLNSRHFKDEFPVVINFSQVISTSALVWYLQGPPSVALKDMEREFSTGLKVAYNVLKPFFEYADGRLVNRMGKLSAFAIANSKFCGSMYSKFGLRVDGVIYPPIDCQIFDRSTLNPSSDYVLTYFGKETKFSDVKRIAGLGIRVKVFGSKMPLQKDLLSHPNLEFLGRVTTAELVEAYSNALFTVFPFTHEPFGYVPLESMACGTPVLTYNLHGPSEYVVDEQTGWLACTGDELVQKAAELWKEGYSSPVRANCRREALRFDKQFYVENWLNILNEFCQSRFDFNRA